MSYTCGVLSKKLEVIKEILMAMFAQLRRGELPLFKLNFGGITLLPKKKSGC
jgi:hypothetical protein